MRGSGPSLSNGLLLSFYGDDYTGSTAVLEILSFAGLPTLLFLGPPTPEQLASVSGYRAVGVAGVARAQSPAWMERHLPPLFSDLERLNAPIFHYKVCSTFDSAPHVGSIGKAIDLAAPVFGNGWHPLVVGAPRIARYQSFGHLFAAIDGVAHRLDRHPVMGAHPVTPMTESDVLRHLSFQTTTPSALIDLVALKAGRGDERLAEALRQGARIVALDVVDDETLAEAGRLMWEHRGDGLVAVGSQGVEYALIAHWHAVGLLAPAAPPAAPSRRDRIAIVSGSCSPVTARQIDVALRNGFAGVHVDPSRAVDSRAWEDEIDRAVEQGLAALDRGRDPLIHTSTGPADPSTRRLAEAVAASGASAGAVNARIGDGLGRALGRILDATDLARVVVAGGDTSGYAGMALGLHAVTALAPLATGAPLCRAVLADAGREGLDISFKGGQMGSEDFFLVAKGEHAGARAGLAGTRMKRDKLGSLPE